MTFHVSLPLPPSANNAFINRKGERAGRIKSSEYRDWRKAAVLSIIAQVRADRRIGGPVRVHISLPVKMAGDIDNRVKPILDALVDSRRIDDDRNVVSLAASKSIASNDAFVTVSAA